MEGLSFGLLISRGEGGPPIEVDLGLAYRAMVYVCESAHNIDFMVYGV
jgi:hypothetical protein